MLAEKKFESTVKRFLKAHNIYHFKVWGGGFQTAGIPDLIACVNGKFVGIEIKAAQGKASKLQLFNIQNIKESGGVGLILYPQDFEEFKNLILNLLKE